MLRIGTLSKGLSLALTLLVALAFPAVPAFGQGAAATLMSIDAPIAGATFVNGVQQDIGVFLNDQLLDECDYAGWRERQAAMRAEGRHIGIGLSTLVQGTAPTQYGVAGRFGSWEAASV